MADSQGSVPVLVQKLCDNILAHASLQTGWNDGYTSTFQAPHHHALGWDRKRKLVLRHLTHTVFDLILLRKWEWFGVWGSEITPECRCLSHTYDMHFWGMHREAARLEKAVSTLMGEGNLLQEKDSILKFLVLVAAGQKQPPKTRGVSQPPEHEACYKSYPSSLFEELPAVEHMCELNMAATDSAELFQCAPGSGFTGFFSSESLGKDKVPSASSLFDGLTHSTITDLNVPLGLPSLPSQPDTISLLSNHNMDSGLGHTGARGLRKSVEGDSGEGEEEWIDPALLAVLAGEEGPAAVKTWEGWEESKCHLSEGGREMFIHATTLCLTRLAPLAGITLPLEGDNQTTPRHLVAALDVLPTSALQPLAVESDSISQAFSRVLSSLLIYCRAQLHDATDGNSDLLAQAAANDLLPLVQFLTQLLSTDTSCPKGLHLLDALYTQAGCMQGTLHYPLLLSLLKQTAVPYLQFVWQWVFKGWLGTDEEFGLHADQESLTRRDHRYWQDGYSLSSPCTPHFLSQHTNTILTCGKAINLLRICCPTHALCSKSFKPPSIAIVVCEEGLQEISHQCQAYISEVAEHTKMSKEQRREKELSREQKAQELAAKARQGAREAAEKIKSVERAHVEEQHEKKRILYQELTHQIQETQALRTEQEAEEERRDREMVAALSLREEALSAEEKRLQEKAKADLVAYYEELSREAERRKMRAEWQARRLSLSQERQQFLQREREKLEREVEAKREELLSGRTQEIRELVETSGGEVGGEEKKMRSRRTWVEGVATPGGHQGRKTWVASLIEAPAAQISDDLSSSTAISPVEEFQTGKQLPSAAEDAVSYSMEQRLEGGVEPGLEGGVEPGLGGGMEPGLEGGVEPGLEGGVEPGLGGGVEPGLEGDVEPGLEGGVEPELEGGVEPKVGGGMEPGLEGEIKPTQTMDSELGHQGQVTPIRVCDLPSIAQDVIYGRELERPEQLERLQLQEKATYSIPREDSTRGQGPPSTAQDIIYPKAAQEDAVSPRLISTRGHAPLSTVQDIMYTQEASSLMKESSRGRAPPSVIQDVMYPRDLSRVTFVSTRGTPPPSSIQQLMYPLRGKEEEERTSQRVKEEEEEEKEERRMFPVFQPYQDSYPMLDLPPTHDILKGLLDPAPSSSHTTDTAFLSLFPLPTLVDHSIALPVLTQSALVNSALVDHFLTDCQISRHFVALKRYLLMEDGEFGHSLTSRLLEELTFGHTWRNLCSPSFLNPLLSTALDSSLLGRCREAERLSFALKYRPSAIKTHTVDALDFLELRYKVDWPCNIVITGDIISRYNKVFHLLLQLKRASWTLKSIFAHLKTAEGLEGWQLRQLQTYRHELQHFITVMQGYLTNQLFHLSWGEFETELNQNVHSLDELIQAHKKFIDTMIFRCLLSKKAKPVMNIIHAILSSVLKFGAQLTLSTSQPQRRYQAMCDTHRTFREAAMLLIKVVTKLVQRGYQPHLEDLLLRLNFNSFYTC